MTLALLPRMLLRQCSVCGRPTPTTLQGRCGSRHAAGAVLFVDLSFGNAWRSTSARPSRSSGRAAQCAAAARPQRCARSSKCQLLWCLALWHELTDICMSVDSAQVRHMNVTCQTHPLAQVSAELIWHWALRSLLLRSTYDTLNTRHSERLLRVGCGYCLLSMPLALLCTSLGRGTNTA